MLIHHYKVNDSGAMTWANLIVATGHNNLAIGAYPLEVQLLSPSGEVLDEMRS